MSPIPVSYRTVTLTVYPWRHPSGRQYWRFEKNLDGKTRRYVTRSTQKKAKDAALEYARQVYAGAIDLTQLDKITLNRIRRMVEVDPELALVDEFLAWRSRKMPTTLLSVARAEFMAMQVQTGISIAHQKSTAYAMKFLDPLANLPISRIETADLQKLLPADKSPVTQGNIQRGWNMLFRWALKNGHLPENGKNPVEALAMPIAQRTEITTYTPDELRLLFAHISPGYLPWLALVAFAGLRSEEVCPDTKSPKPPLDWSDIRWDQGVVIVRPETSKTNQRRVIELCPALRSWLEPIKKESGRLTPIPPPSFTETKRIGGFIGGWKANALRHSFISYRAALAGIGQASMDAGNSERIARRVYVNARSREEADAWFSVFRECSAKTKGAEKSPQVKRPGKSLKTKV
jgi:integrase